MEEHMYLLFVVEEYKELAVEDTLEDFDMVVEAYKYLLYQKKVGLDRHLAEEDMVVGDKHLVEEDKHLAEGDKHLVVEAYMY
jgi:hypothetical protein